VRARDVMRASLCTGVVAQMGPSTWTPQAAGRRRAVGQWPETSLQRMPAMCQMRPPPPRKARAARLAREVGGARKRGTNGAATVSGWCVWCAFCKEYCDVLVLMYLCICVSCVFVYLGVYLCICLTFYRCICLPVYLTAYPYISVCAAVCARARLCACVCVHIHTCMYACTYTRIQESAQTHHHRNSSRYSHARRSPRRQHRTAKGARRAKKKKNQKTTVTVQPR
jgi:hypothetical protein